MSKKSQVSAAKRRKSTPHGASRGLAAENHPAPRGRKNLESPPLPEIRLIPIPIADEIHPADTLSDKLIQSLFPRRIRFESGDVLVLKHKIVSKSEGQIVALDTIHPSTESIAWAKQHALDARVIELALRESRSVIRRRNGVLITETRHGFLCANSGVDVSNVDGGYHAVLLPKDPDRSAAKIRNAIKQRTGLSIAVLITDSFGRPWREGLVDFCIGIAGMKPLRDDRGRKDSHGYELHASIEAVADELAAAAGLVCGKLNRTPACIIRGFHYESGPGRTRDLLRSAATDLFR
ncbi:MAG: coenzyme F420-0:L-glutamate ligase [Candidatus Sulfotelmatobacter sp.]